MMSRQLTWYSNLTSEEGTVTTRDVEPFVLCSDKVQFIDPSCRLDLLPMDEGSFLPPQGKGHKDFPQSKPSHRIVVENTYTGRSKSKTKVTVPHNNNLERLNLTQQ